MNTKEPRIYKSQILSELISNTSEEELQKTESKMRLAIKIADGIKATRLNKSEFAKKINKNNSEITKWLSGTHNFTTDTLILLQNELNIKLVDDKMIEKIAIKNIHIVTKSSNTIMSGLPFFNSFNFPKPDYIHLYSLTA